MNRGDVRSSRIFYGWYIVMAAFSVNFIGHGMQHSFGVFLKPLSEEFSWSRSLTAGAFMVFMLCRGCSIFVMGHLTEKFGPRRVVAAGGVLMGLGMILGSAMTTIWELYLYYGLLVGAGMGVIPVPLSATLSRWFVARRGMVQGLYASGAGAANLILSPLAGYLIYGFGIKTAFLVMGLGALVLMNLSAMVLIKDPVDSALRPYGAGMESTAENGHASGAASGETSEDWAPSEAFRTGSLWILCVIAFIFGIGLYLVRNCIVAFATDQGIPETTAPYLLSVMGGSHAIATIFMGILADRIGARRILLCSLVVQGLVLFSLEWVSGLAWLSLLLAIFGVSYVGVLLPLVIITPQYFGLKSLGTVLGMVMFIHMLGAAAGSEMGNLFYDYTSDHSYAPAFLLAGGNYLAVTVLALMMKTPQRKGHI